MLKEILTGTAITVVGAGAGFVGGAVYKDKTIDVTQKDEYKQVVEDNQELSTKLDTTQITLTGLAKQRDSLEETKIQLESQLETTQLNLDDKTAELEAKQSELDLANEQITALNAQITTLKAEAQENAEQITALQEQVTNLTASKQSLEAEISNLQENIEEYTQQINTLQETISSKDNELSALNEQINKLYGVKTNFTSFEFDVKNRFNVNEDDLGFQYLMCPNNKIIMTVYRNEYSKAVPINDETTGLWEYDPFFDTLTKIDDQVISIIPIDENLFFAQYEDMAKLCYFDETNQICEYGQLSSSQITFYSIIQDDNHLALNIQMRDDNTGNKYQYVIYVDKTQNKIYQYKNYSASCIVGKMIMCTSTTSAYNTHRSLYDTESKEMGALTFKNIEYIGSNDVIWTEVKNSSTATDTIVYYDGDKKTSTNITLPVTFTMITCAVLGNEVLISCENNGEGNLFTYNLETMETKNITFESDVEEISAPSASIAQRFKGAPIIGGKYYVLGSYYSESTKANAPCLYSYDKDASIIKCEKLSGAISTYDISIGTIVRNEQLFQVGIDYTQIDGINKIGSAYIIINKIDLENMSLEFVTIINCQDALGEDFEYASSLKIVDDENNITIASPNGLAYVYDFENFKVLGKTQFDLKK